MMMCVVLAMDKFFLGQGRMENPSRCNVDRDVMV